MAAKKTPERLTDLDAEEAGELLSLLGGADSAELKLTVPDVDHRATIATLGLDPLEAQIRQVFFLDTHALDLNEAGVVARARRIQGRNHDSVVKLRPVTPESLPRDLREDPNLTVEVDGMPGSYVCSASLKRELKPARVSEVLKGQKPIHKLFSKQQRALLEEHSPPGVEIDDLAILGPIFVLKLKLLPADLPRKLVAEMWLYPDGKRILELSTKCPPAEVFDVAMQARAHLGGLGVNLSGEQETKTKTALEFFAAEHRAA